LGRSFVKQLQREKIENVEKTRNALGLAVILLHGLYIIAYLYAGLTRYIAIEDAFVLIGIITPPIAAQAKKIFVYVSENPCKVKKKRKDITFLFASLPYILVIFHALTVFGSLYFFATSEIKLEHIATALAVAETAFAVFLSYFIDTIFPTDKAE
jgi:hypothetical protein